MANVVKGERQGHGLEYENTIESRNYGVTLSEKYGTKFDGFIKLSNGKEVPVSIKTKALSKSGTRQSIECGDIFRQANVDEDFIMFVGYYSMVNGVRVYKEEYCVYMHKGYWTSLFPDDFQDEYKKFLSNLSDDEIANHSINCKEAKRLKKKRPIAPWANITKEFKKDWKNKGYHNGITPAFKISKDSYNIKTKTGSTQKRIQCLLKQKFFMDNFVKNYSVDLSNIDNSIITYEKEGR